VQHFYLHIVKIIYFTKSGQLNKEAIKMQQIYTNQYCTVFLSSEFFCCLLNTDFYSEIQKHEPTVTNVKNNENIYKTKTGLVIKYAILWSSSENFGRFQSRFYVKFKRLSCKSVTFEYCVGQLGFFSTQY